MGEDKGLDEGREGGWVDGGCDKGVAECRGGHVECNRGRRGDLHRNRLKGELELLTGWTGLGLLLRLWLLLGVCVVCVRVRAWTGRVGWISGRGKGRGKGRAPCEAAWRRRRCCRR